MIFKKLIKSRIKKLKSETVGLLQKTHLFFFVLFDESNLLSWPSLGYMIRNPQQLNWILTCFNKPPWIGNSGYLINAGLTCDEEFKKIQFVKFVAETLPNTDIMSIPFS